MIIFNNVNYGAPSQVLFNIDLKIIERELVFLVGDHGAGKTAMLRLIIGLDKPSKGQIVVKGRSISAVSYRGLALARQGMGIILDEFDFFPNLTVQENLELPLVLRGIEKKERDERIVNLIENLNLTQKRYFKAKELSSQEKKMCLTARAILTKSELILADDIFDGLEEKWAEIFIQKIIELINDGTTVIITTNNKTIADRFAERKRIITLSQGKIINDEVIGKGVAAEIEGMLNNV